MFTRSCFQRRKENKYHRLRTEYRAAHGDPQSGIQTILKSRSNCPPSGVNNGNVQRFLKSSSRSLAPTMCLSESSHGWFQSSCPSIDQGPGLREVTPGAMQYLEFRAYLKQTTSFHTCASRMPSFTSLARAVPSRC